MRATAAAAAVAVLAGMLAATAARAQYGRIPPTAVDPAALAIDEAAHLGLPVSPDLALLDRRGRPFRLGELLGQPLVLVLSYYRCDGSCPTLNRALAKAVRGMPRLRSGTDFRVLTVSFDRQDTLERLNQFVREQDPPAGWRYAIFQRAEDLDRLTDKLGYKFYWSVRDGVFLHPNVVIILTAEGRVARYLYGLNLRPRDLELALVEARGGQIARAGQVIDYLTALCFSYSFSEGRYVLNYPLFIALGALSFGIGLVVFSFTVYRKRKPRRWVHV